MPLTLHYVGALQPHMQFTVYVTEEQSTFKYPCSRNLCLSIIRGGLNQAIYLKRAQNSLNFLFLHFKIEQLLRKLCPYNFALIGFPLKFCILGGHITVKDILEFFSFIYIFFLTHILDCFSIKKTSNINCLNRSFIYHSPSEKKI